ncbi:hypothetical protein D3C87_1394260 [compost metagenome]|jgi:hypothetical protein|uniref:hypothetical protein n=1 Tax=Sphingobacterium faecium TaxID=34087 RepID=UPI000D473C19|nr:hypothetical protein [Sphingobacterium faecium]MQP26839.1 hypothetical protein [Sphingobacterium faecium]PTX12616.1 hypothetical protein C8N37_102311 [Sphingobacterium faecium]GEM62322.1 hypothetical protein SF1_03040 [Sphingobacterium faecium NBRC 15299]
MMNSVSYDPQELLITLMEFEKKLTSSIAKNCPDRDMALCDDLDKALDDFLQLQGVRNNEVGYLSSQLALLHLRREIQKTMEIVVTTNNLRAFQDFKVKIEEESQQAPALMRQWGSSDLILAAILGGLIAAALTFFVVLP